jgi:hypothetical protein
VSKLNKFGELKDISCSKCGYAVKAEWVACPACGARLRGSPDAEGASNGIRFVCPGCEEKATAAEGARLCITCNAFVHRTCCVRGKMVAKGKVPLFGRITYTTHEYLCPVCGAVMAVDEEEGNE